jgi:hypothetical protein
MYTLFMESELGYDGIKDATNDLRAIQDSKSRDTVEQECGETLRMSVQD